jgi:amidohydrolase
MEKNSVGVDVAGLCKERESAIIRWRREFHEHPELSFRETWTSGRIQEELKKMGIPFDLVPNSDNVERLQTFGIPKEAAGALLNVVGRIEGTKPASGPPRRFAQRADIDALPVKEETGLPVASSSVGLLHACGHDAHAAMLLGAASVLNECRDSFSGTLYLCFQSAEEIGGGAPQIAEYLRGKGGVDGIAALHIWGTLPTGQFLIREGATMSGFSAFRITLKGKGGHGSRPDLVKDPVKAACDLTLKLSSIPSNFYDVMDNCAIHVCMVNAGTAANIFPETALILGGARYFKKEGNAKIKEAMETIAEGVGKVWGVDIKIDYMPAMIPIVNDRDLAQLGLEAVFETDGLEAPPSPEPIAASDNFCFLSDVFPGLYGFLGGAKKGEAWEQHNSHFDIDESVMVKGSEFLCRCALNFLG